MRKESQKKRTKATYRLYLTLVEVVQSLRLIKILGGETRIKPVNQLIQQLILSVIDSKVADGELTDLTREDAIEWLKENREIHAETPFNFKGSVDLQIQSDDTDKKLTQVILDKLERKTQQDKLDLFGD